MVQTAGFADVRTLTSTVSPRLTDPEHCYRWSMWVGQRQLWEAIPDDRLDEVETEVLAAVGRCRDERGRIGFDQVVRYTLGTHPG